MCKQNKVNIAQIKRKRLLKRYTWKINVNYQSKILLRNINCVPTKYNCMYNETNNLSTFIIITFKTFHCIWTSSRTICRIFVVYIKLWCITKWWYKGSQSMLQRRTTVTAPDLYNSLCRKRTVRRILQRKVGRSYLPWRIWSRQCIYRTLWSNSTRYILKNTHKMNLKWIYAQKKTECPKQFFIMD